MARNQTKEVNGCKDCPFAIAGHAEYCALHPARIDISQIVRESGTLLGQIDGTPPYPIDCPLKGLPCVVKLRHTKAKAGRPMPAVTPGRNFEAEVAHFWEFVNKRYAPDTRTKGSWVCPPSRVHADNQTLSIHHLRAALAGRRPFHEAEFDAVVKWAKSWTEYPGYTPPPAPNKDEELNALFTL